MRTVSALFVIFAFVLCGCAPVVRMTVENRDGFGNLVDRLDVTNKDSGASRTLIVSSSHTIIATAEAEFKDGLQGLWIEGDFTCFDPGTGTGTGSVQQGGFLAPTHGNAISGNQTPPRFSFTETFSIACGKPGYTLSLRAGARSVPTTGLFGGGPATSWTQPAVFRKP